MSGFVVQPIPHYGVYRSERRRYSDEHGEFAWLWSADALSAKCFRFGPLQLNHSSTRLRATIGELYFQATPLTEPRFISSIRCSHTSLTRRPYLQGLAVGGSLVTLTRAAIYRFATRER
jgi:hypothetical protein